MHLIVTTFREAVIKVEVANFGAAIDTLIDQDGGNGEEGGEMGRGQRGGGKGAKGRGEGERGGDGEGEKLGQEEGRFHRWI